MNISILMCVRRFVLPVIIISFFSAFLFAQPEKAHAGGTGFTLYCTFGGGPCPPDSTVWYSLSTDKDVYAPGETINIELLIGSDDHPREPLCPFLQLGINRAGYGGDVIPGCYTAGDFRGMGVVLNFTKTAPASVGAFNLSISAGLSLYLAAGGIGVKDIPLMVAAPTCSYSGPWAWGGAGNCFDPGKNFNNTPVGNTVSFFNTDSRFTPTSYFRATCTAGGWVPAGESCVPVGPVCGNGVREGSESCDAGASNGSCPSACSTSCTTNTCGVAGACGPANGTAISLGFAAIPVSQMCSAGTRSSFAEVWYLGDSISGAGNHTPGPGDYTGGWFWQCNGTSGNAGCMGYTPAVCGTANGGTFASAPSDPPSFRTTLCQTGTPTGVTTNASTYTWSCNNAPAASIACSANRASSMTAQITALGPVALEDGGFWSKLISFITGEDNVASASGPDAYINFGQKARIDWTSAGLPSSCLVSGTGYSGSSMNGSQTLAGLPVGTHTYTITCSKPGFSSASDSVRVIVASVGPSIPGTPGGSGGGEGGITANPQSCGTGQINVSWTPVTGATTYTLRDGSSIIAASTGATSFAHTGLSASSSHSYNLRAENSAGNSAYSSSVSATAPGACGGPVPPTLTFGASPTSITAGSPSTLMWEPVNATSCWASDGWTGSRASSGSNSFVVNPMVTTTYSLECWNSIGISSGRQSTTVNVGAAPVGPDLTSSGLTVPLSVAVGTPLNFSATVRNVGTSGTGIGFRDNFSYSTASNSGPWTDRPTIAKGALASGGTSVDNDSYTPSSAGTIWIQHCVDSTNVIAEGANETPNCTVANGGAGTTVTGGASPSLTISGCTIAQGASKCVSKPSSVANGNPAQFYGIQNITTGISTANLYSSPTWTYNPGSGVGTAVELTYGLNTLELWRTAGMWIAPKIQTVTASANCNTGGGDVWSVPLGRCVAGAPAQCADGIDNSDPEDILIDMADPGCSSAGDTDETDTASATPPVITINTKTNSIIVVNPGDTVTIGWDTNNGDETSCTLTTSTNPDNIGNTVIFLPGGGNAEQGTLVSGAIFVKTKFTVTCAGVTDTVTVEPISGPIET